MDSISFIILSIFVFMGGFIDSIAGGGGIITIPAYINYGIDFNLLLGTNKLSSTSGTLIATIKYLKEIKFEKIYLIKIALSSFLGASLGALFISSLKEYVLKLMVLFLLPSISLYLLKEKKFGIFDSSEKISKKKRDIFSILISFIISFYDGSFGPGTGTFLAIAYCKFIGYDILKSTAVSKFTNLISNISALVVFIFLEKVNLKIGFLMGLISIAGNYTGSLIALKNGVFFIKKTLFFISNLILIKIIIDLVK